MIDGSIVIEGSLGMTNLTLIDLEPIEEALAMTNVAFRKIEVTFRMTKVAFEIIVKVSVNVKNQIYCLDRSSKHLICLDWDQCSVLYQ